MLEMLDDMVEADKFQTEKDTQLRKMNQIMDARAQQRYQIKMDSKKRQIEKESENCLEEFSQILLRENSRVTSYEQLQANAGKRRFVRFDQIFTQDDTYKQLSTSQS